MARKLPSGTPTRSKRYIFPADTGRRWALAGLAGAVLLVGLPGLYVMGVTRFVSPGDVAAEHATIDLQCAQCHETGLTHSGVMDLRCERCHDIGGSERLTNAGHVLFGSASALKADAAEDVACVQCHTEHRGRDWGLATVDDRECAQCHLFGTLGRHPEFATINASIQTGLGLKFDHDRHIVEATDAGLDECEACHVPTVDQTAFEPIRFDEHCAACHTDDDGFVTGNTDPIGPEYILAPDEVLEPWAPEIDVETIAAARGRSEYTRMRHADRWTLYNARRLRRAIDPAGEASERQALAGRIAYLEQQLTIEPLTTSGSANLEAWADAFEREVVELERRLASQPTPETDIAALEAMTAATRTLAATLASTAGGEANVGDPAVLPAASVGSDTAGNSAAEFEARRAELLSLLEAVDARGGERLVDRVATLRNQVNGLSPQGGEPDTAAYRNGLFALDEIVRVLRSVPDPQARFEAAELDVLRSLAQQQVTGGLALDEFEERRRQLLSLISAIERDGTDELRGRAAPLRQRVLALRQGADGDADLRRRIRRRRKDLDRVHLEMELAAAGDSAPVGTAAPLRDRAAVQNELGILRTQLAALEGGSRPGVALGEDRERQGFALESLFVPCLKCHELSGPKLAPVTVAEPVMTRALFDHAPHVIQAECAACHGSAATSGLATDVNVPGVENCQSCHQPNEARADCATCHVYHPPSVAALLREP
jgi:hypothetical protein